MVNKQPIKRKKTGCTCKKTNCLKMYCECFQKGIPCGPSCNCCDCKNGNGSHDREEKCRVLTQKNKSVFNQKLVVVGDSKTLVHRRGCNCKKNNCAKNYCECHQLGVKCSELCNCTECKNDGMQQERQRKIEKRERVKFK